MLFDTYQQLAARTAVYPGQRSMEYAALGLANEAGEVAGVVKKFIRDEPEYQQSREQMKKELGDTLWYLSECARTWGLQLSEIAEYNIAKLLDRQDRGVLKGSGDDR